jgi:hypothetical protein
MTTSNANPAFYRQNYMDAKTYEIVSENGDVFTVSELDPLSESLQRFLEELTLFEIVDYDGRQFTTIIYEKYGTTSLWWLVLLVNGLLSRTELRVGMALKFPILQEVQNAKMKLPIVRDTVLV